MARKFCETNPRFEQSEERLQIKLSLYKCRTAIRMFPSRRKAHQTSVIGNTNLATFPSVVRRSASGRLSRSPFQSDIKHLRGEEPMKRLGGETEIRCHANTHLHGKYINTHRRPLLTTAISPNTYRGTTTNLINFRMVA